MADGHPGHQVRSAAPEAHTIEQCHIPSGTFTMGDQHGDGYPSDGEQPVHQVTVPAFSIDATTVTNRDFAGFVEATGYQTEAQRWGFSAVFHLAVSPTAKILGNAPRTPWWLTVEGADWAHPEGPDSDIESRADHPVVHVAHTDARAYCAWAGRRLPSEVEWERASRGGREGLRFPWGDDTRDAHGAWLLNIWQGTFPTENTLEDGYLTTAPVRTFAPNDFGLWQSVGNVWEWCADVFDPAAYARRAGRSGLHPLPDDPTSARVLRGGSYLCHDSYCNRYRNSARTANTPDSSMGNAGFRTVLLQSDHE
ncbi:MAG: formylglycine-generating enzyme family protein [Actinomycetales bacterium]